MDNVTDKPKNKGGRPTKYTPQIAAEICTLISNGMSVRQMLKADEKIGRLPSQATIYEWLIVHPEFAEQYARAREDQADTLADEILQIADETPDTEPVIDRRTGELIRMELSNSYIQWQRNRIDARKWTAMKLKPKKYGDRTVIAGDKENPLQSEIVVTAKDAMNTIVEHLQLKKQNANAGS